ncbi:MAG: hypothetical protein RIE77_11710 [Phycisphaerales bacterium]|jgi:uncharacterized membrane protein
MLSQRFAESWSPALTVAATVLGIVTIARGAWKLVRFVGLLRLFRRWCIAANARLGIVDQRGVLTERERRAIEGRTSASERAGPPMIF